MRARRSRLALFVVLRFCQPLGLLTLRRIFLPMANKRCLHDSNWVRWVFIYADGGFTCSSVSYHAAQPFSIANSPLPAADRLFTVAWVLAVDARQRP